MNYDRRISVCFFIENNFKNEISMNIVTTADYSSILIVIRK